MLTIKNMVKLYKYKKLVNKRNKEYLQGNYAKAKYYGEMVNKYMDDVLKF